MKKILLLAPADNPHTIKWANSLYGLGHSIILITLGKYHKENYSKNIKIHALEQNINKHGSLLSKLKYISAVKIAKRVIKEEKPDIIHAHYATSYGVIGALIKGSIPLFLSVWGSDIYIFPKKSNLHKFILRFSLNKANKIFSTSYAMKEETLKYIDKNIDVIPFGIDIDKFHQIKKNDLLIDDLSGSIVIGTVKGLEKVYGIEYLIRAFEIIIENNQDLSIKLVIVGKGNEKKNLENLVKELKVEQYTIFTGYIDPSKVVEYHNLMDIEVFMSESESFGVSVLEASACEKPVIVSNVGGLPEVVEDSKTGFIVESRDYEKLADYLQLLIDNEEMRINIGKRGREMVIEKYIWINNAKEMSRIYESWK